VITVYVCEWQLCSVAGGIMVLSLSNIGIRQYPRNDTVVVIIIIIIVRLFCSGDASRHVTVRK